jgi:DNA ligase (NAD+)
MTKNDVAIGDLVEIEKANEIIPKLVSVQDRPTTRKSNTPVNCPSCGSVLAARGVDIACENSSCGAQIMSKLLHFIRALNIEGFSTSAIQKLIDSKLLDQKSLFELDATDLQMFGNLGPKQSSSFIRQLKNLEVTKPEFLAALGIPGCGISKWEKILEKIEFDKIVDAQVSETELLQVVGTSTSAKIIRGLAENEDFIKETLPYLKIVEQKTASIQPSTMQGTPTNRGTGKSLKGKIFCITGTLGMLRNYYVQEIENRGGKVTGISARVDYLVCGLDPGSKLQKAKKLNVSVINEDDLIQML